MIDDGRPLFLQIADGVERDILDGTIAENSQVPSTNELAAFHRINPATAAKGITVLVDKGVLVKRRGIGMFVADGARELLVEERRTTFANRYLDPLLHEARSLGLGPDDLARMLASRADALTTKHDNESSAS